MCMRTLDNHGTIMAQICVMHVQHFVCAAHLANVVDGRPVNGKLSWVPKTYQPFPKGGMLVFPLARLRVAPVNLKLVLWPFSTEMELFTQKDPDGGKVMTFCDYEETEWLWEDSQIPGQHNAFLPHKPQQLASAPEGDPHQDQWPAVVKDHVLLTQSHLQMWTQYHLHTQSGSDEDSKEKNRPHLIDVPSLCPKNSSVLAYKLSLLLWQQNQATRNNFDFIDEFIIQFHSAITDFHNHKHAQPESEAWSWNAKKDKGEEAHQSKRSSTPVPHRRRQVAESLLVVVIASLLASATLSTEIIGHWEWRGSIT